MDPSLTINPAPPVQQRLNRFTRQPDQVAARQITDKSFQVMATIERYRFAPSSLLVRLVPGGQRNNYRHLQTLYHKNFINRFALPTVYGTPGEFVYYLDTLPSLHLLVEKGLLKLPEDQLRRSEENIRLNRQRAYHQLHKDPDQQGKLLYIQHELMISRFHALLELTCRKFAGRVALEQWKQGPDLWHHVEVPQVRKLEIPGQWQELPGKEWLPHRPDAFFTLRFPGNPEGRQHSHFFYEADRGTENTTRFKMKLRAHWHFIVKQNLHRTMGCYNVHGIRAVLTESTTSQWAHNLRQAAKENVVSPKPSPLFWFTTSELLTKPTASGKRTLPLYLVQPEVIFKRIWADPVQDKFFNLAD